MSGILMILIVFFPFCGAILSYLTGRKDKKVRDRVVAGVTIIEFLMMVLLLITNGTTINVMTLPGICQMGLSFEADGYRVVYGTIAAFMWMMSSLFSAEYFAHYRNRNRYYLFQLITLGATEAVFLSGDLYTTFIFFEIMSLASYVWVAQDERPESLRAGLTYLAVAVIGGLVMLMGLFLLYAKTGTLAIDALYEASQGKNVWPAALCMVFGFGAKAGAFPLHIWLPKAHPVAPAPASALLSGILTKTGIFGVLVISCKILFHDPVWGTFVLCIGVLTMFAGAVLAVFSIDFKRTLACSSVSQIGFILVGIGMQGLLGEENLLAVNGSMLHMVNHSLFKLTLFMVAGVIYMNLHKLDLNDIRGFGRKKPLLMLIYLSGALGIGGIPLFSGYISKTLIHEGIVEYIELLHEGHVQAILFDAVQMKIIEWIFLISGGMTVAYMTKLFVCVFIERNDDPDVQRTFDEMNGHYMNPVSAAVLSFCAILFPIFGCMPGQIMEKIADMSHGFMGFEGELGHIHYFSLTNLKGGVISILIGAYIYLVIVRMVLMRRKKDGTSRYMNYWPHYLDIEDHIYRPLLLTLIPTVCDVVFGFLNGLFDNLIKLIPLAGSIEGSFFNTIEDPLIIAMKERVYTGSIKPDEYEEGNVLTNCVGNLLNLCRNLLNKTFRRSNPVQKDFVHEMALVYTFFKENVGLIGRSLSYGLLLFCLGLCITLVYLLLKIRGM